MQLLEIVTGQAEATRFARGSHESWRAAARRGRIVVDEALNSRHRPRTLYSDNTASIRLISPSLLSLRSYDLLEQMSLHSWCP
jgi:hypothetical protein